MRLDRVSPYVPAQTHIVRLDVDAADPEGILAQAIFNA
jgi:hypothetical protein